MHLECRLCSCAVDTRHDFRQEGRKLSSVEARASHATGRAYIRFTSNRGVSTIDVNGTIVLRPIIALPIPIHDRVRRNVIGDVENKATSASLIHQNCLEKARPEMRG